MTITGKGCFTKNYLPLQMLHMYGAGQAHISGLSSSQTQTIAPLLVDYTGTRASSSKTPADYSSNYGYYLFQSRGSITNPLPFPSANTSCNYTFIAYGSGSAPATEDDYTLENLIEGYSLSYYTDNTYYKNTDYSITSKTISMSYDELGPYSILEIYIYNNKENNITIRELGFYESGSYSSAGSAAPNYTTNQYLFYRYVFDEDIILEPTKSCTLQFKIRLGTYNS